MKLDALVVGPFGVNCFVVSADEAETCVVIDPGGDIESICQVLEARGQRPELVLLTHSHFDHAGALLALQEAYPEISFGCHPVCGQLIGDPRANLSPAVAGHAVRLPAPDQSLDDRMDFEAGGLAFTAFHVPGHAPGHLAFYVAEGHAIFSGDLVLGGVIGRVDLPGGDEVMLCTNIQTLFKTLPPETVIHPGHGPVSSVGAELAQNPYLQR